MTWEERWHPLREEWVIVAAHRQNRPWSGETLHLAAPLHLRLRLRLPLLPLRLRL